MFIAVDGIDGAGKTTLANQLRHLLAPLKPVLTKEPTDRSEWGRLLRQSASSRRLPRDVELDYFHRDRLFHIEHVIAPATNEGFPVISDRYVDSTLAFQADTPEEADRLYQRFLPDILVPDLTLILVCPVEMGLNRIVSKRGKATTFERPETLRRAARIYESRQGPNYVLVDATGSPDDTFRQVLYILWKACTNRRRGLDRSICSTIQQVEANGFLGSDYRLAIG